MNIEAHLNKEKETVIEWLGIDKKIPRNRNISFLYMDLIRSKLKNKSVSTFIKHSSLSQKQVSRIIHVSERTLQRNTPEKEMDMGVSERLIELTRLFHKGIEVFNNKEKFVIWLHRPNKSFQNHLPIEIIETSIGTDLVYDELLRIEHGVFS